MNKFKNIFFAVILAIAGINTAKADYATDCDGPLPCRFSITGYGGVNPSIFTDRGNTFGVAPVQTLENPFIELVRNRKFSQLFKQPGVSAGVMLGFNLAPCVELFGEFNYRSNGGDFESFDATATVNNQNITLTASGDLDGLTAYSGFIGMRYFFDRIFCNRLAFFIGSKVGIVHYNKVKVEPLRANIGDDEVFSQNVLWYDTTNTVGGGVQFGFDVGLWGCASFFWNVEALATGAPKTNTIITNPNANANFPLTNLVREQSQGILSFPINFGLRYYFG